MEEMQYWTEGIQFLFLGIGTWFDLKTRELPVWFLAVFGVLAMICDLAWKYQSLTEMMLGCIVGGSFLVIGLFTKEAIGYGDGLGIMILGIFRGGTGLLQVLFGAFLLSGAYGLWKVFGRRESLHETMPFFPFLLLAWIGVILL